MYTSCILCGFLPCFIYMRIYLKKKKWKKVWKGRSPIFWTCGRKETVEHLKMMRCWIKKNDEMLDQRLKSLFLSNLFAWLGGCALKKAQCFDFVDWLGSR